MIRHDQRYVAPLQPFSSKLHDAFLGAKQRFHCNGPEGANRLGVDCLKLAVKKLAADFHFVRLRRAIFGRAALDHVAYVDILALDGNALFLGRSFNHLREKLSGPADERQSLLVLVGPRAFAYKHQFRLLVPGTKHYFVPALVQSTPLAVTNIFAYFGEIVMIRTERKYYGQLGAMRLVVLGAGGW